jgi:hypothetical protein
MFLSLLFTLPCSADPDITLVSLVSDQQSQTIDIYGSGFGTQAPYTGDSDYIYFLDENAGHPWEAGDTLSGNVIGLIVDSWTPTEITLGGFAPNYDACPSCGWYLTDGDPYEIAVWNPQTDSGPANFDGIVGTEATPEPPSVLLTVCGLLAFAFVAMRKRLGARLFGQL